MGSAGNLLEETSSKADKGKTLTKKKKSGPVPVPASEVEYFIDSDNDDTFMWVLQPKAVLLLHRGRQ